MTKRTQLIILLIVGASLIGMGIAASFLSQHSSGSEQKLSIQGQSPSAALDEVILPEAAEAAPKNASQNTTNDLYSADVSVDGVSTLYEYASKGSLDAQQYPKIRQAVGTDSMPYTIDIKLPKLTAVSSDAKAANEEIAENFGSVIRLPNDQALLLDQDAPVVQRYFVRYFVAQTPQTVSVVVCSTILSPAAEVKEDCSVYNFEKNSWRRISPQELFQLNGLDSQLAAKMYEQKNKAPNLKNPKCPDYYIDGNDVWGLFPQENGVSRIKLTTDQESDEQYLSVLDALIQRHTYLTDHLFSSRDLIQVPAGMNFDPNQFYPVTAPEFSSISAFREYVDDTYFPGINGYFPLTSYLRSLKGNNPPMYEKDGKLYICKSRSPRYADNANLDFTDYSAKILDFIDDSVYFSVSLYQKNDGKRTLVTKQIVITYQDGSWKISSIIG